MAKYSLIQSTRTQFVKLPPVHHVDLTGQTVVVTGSNVGLGLETARHFARMNPANLILAVRNKQKGDNAVINIRESTGYQGNLEVMIVDQNDFGSVSAFVTKFEQTHDRLDVLVLNAAVGVLDFEKSKDGWETSLQVNHLSTAMLSILLLPRMVETGKRFSTHPRITIVSSDLHFHSTIVKKLKNEVAILAKMNDPKYSTIRVMLGRYDDTKLLNVFLARGLTSRLPATSSIIVDSVNPGFCHSDLRRNANWPLTWIFRLMELIMARKTEEGAKTIVWAALAGHDNAAVRESLRGAYTSECTVVEASDAAISQDGQVVEKKIWNETIDIISAIDPRVRAVVEAQLQ